MNTYLKRVSKFGLPVAALVVLSACGGGGESMIGIQATPTTVSGVASKGLVKDAKVLVC